MKDLYIIGTGSQARYIIENNNSYAIKGLVDIEDKGNVGGKINGVDVVCFLEDIEEYIEKETSEIIIAYGNNKKKKILQQNYQKKGIGLRQ